MKSLSLIQHPEYFQGEKKKSKSSPYFEGWYFKCTSLDSCIAFIIGIQITKQNKSSFIQVITEESSYYFSFPIESFSFCQNPFQIKIEKNIFSFDTICVHLNNSDVCIKGRATLKNHHFLQKPFYAPNIMGPFSYLPFMECNHAIVSMYHTVTGLFKINENTFSFSEGVGYIEKDWGCSFPSSYVWCQANSFLSPQTNLFLSIATIPIGKFHFTGYICAFLWEGKEFLFTTYDQAKLVEKNIKKEQLSFHFSSGGYHLFVHSHYDKNQKLLAPRCGEMNRYIKESITSPVSITFQNQNSIVYSETCSKGGLEICW